MQRRQFFLSPIASGLILNQLFGEQSRDFADRCEEAAKILKNSVASGQVRSAVILIRDGSRRFERAFGAAQLDSPFLLGSISKPICISALMSLFDKAAFSLNDLASKYLPEFRGEGRDQVRISHLLTHVSGLPDQLPENASLRKSHASLDEFVKGAMRVPLGFPPGSKYEYSSMAILLAMEIARRLSGQDILSLVTQSVLKPLKMTHSAIGMGSLTSSDVVSMQIEHAAPEAGGGDPTAKQWDWNSRYWRELGAPWGGVHASAGDILKFLDAMLEPVDGFLSADTAAMMIRNHNPAPLVPRGLGFAVGPQSLGTGCSSDCFGHTGSTGTIAWSDPQRNLACVVLTSLPAQAIKPHPRDLASACLNRNAT